MNSEAEFSSHTKPSGPKSCVKLLINSRLLSSHFWIISWLLSLISSILFCRINFFSCVNKEVSLYWLISCINLHWEKKRSILWLCNREPSSVERRHRNRAQFERPNPKWICPRYAASPKTCLSLWSTCTRPLYQKMCREYRHGQQNRSIDKETKGRIR